MMKSIDLKSFLIGGLLTLSIVLVLGATPRLLSPGPVGRYALVVARVPEGDTYVLDTSTGQLWPRLVRGRLDTTFYAPKLGMQTPTEPNKPNAR